MILAILVGSGVCPGLAQEPARPGGLPGLGPLTPAEQWVLESVAAGRIADLRERFGEAEGARRLRGKFVETMLTDGFSGFKVHRSGIYLLNAVIPDILSLEFAEVQHPVFLHGCRFQGLVNGNGANFKKNLSLKEAVFMQPVDFYRLKVAMDAFFGGAVFGGAVNFGSAQIDGQLTLKGAKFTAKDQEANFNGLVVGGSLSLQNARFEGAVDVTGARMGAELNAQGARFSGPDKIVSFTGVKVGQVASFNQAEFQGPVNLAGAEINGMFSANGARFESAGQPVSFDSLKVGPWASFNGAVFKGPVSFTNASFAGTLAVMEARLEAKEHPAKFFGLRVDNFANFMETVFQGGVSMVGGSFKNLMITGSAATPLTYPEVNLDGAQVDYSLIIADLRLEKLQATRLQVKGPVIFKNLKIGQKADLRDSNFYSLKMIEVGWPANPAQIWLEGLTYQALSAGEGPQDWRKLSAWINDSRYDTRNYSQLSDYFKHGGYQDRADEVYIQGQRRQALDKWWRPDHLATLIFWDFLAGYGKKPGRTFWLGLIIVMVGTLFFDPQNFDPSFLGGWTWLLNGNVWRTRVVRFFLSLDEFLPGVDLGLARLWQMSKISYPTLLYYHFHKISGWILVPIGLAAVFSQFR
ncbi:MAG: hypothetical protein NTY36_15040 [Deltaproteobacteria bacterium]|nr:hypothetical protein [Deltaproteobacteria bacterium]